MNRRWLGLWFCALDLALALGCSSTPPGMDDEGSTGVAAAALIDSEDCLAGSVDGKVGICHATGSAPNTYVHINVSTNGCINGHAKHAGDFVSDLATDANNCGACGHACSYAHAASACTAGVCTHACDAAYGDCDGLAANGCETDITTTANCGGCGKVCSYANATAQCAGGSCNMLSCVAGFADCDGLAANGCETDITTTVNCGGCGNVCNYANATAHCAGGSCNMVSCVAGHADCDGLAANGCETDITTTANCGACGNVCSPAHAVALCWIGECRRGPCDAGYGDFHDAYGCETDLTTITLFEVHPVALGNATPLNVEQGCNGTGNGQVTFSHSASFDESVNHMIVEYQWIFTNESAETWVELDNLFQSYDWKAIPLGENWMALPRGYSADGKAFHTSDRYATPTYTYCLPGIYKPVLRVVDNHNPPMTETYVVHSVTVSAMP